MKNILLLLLLAAAAASAFDPKNKTSFSGVVMARNVAVPGLTVLLLSASGDTIASGFTDDAGEFEFTGVPVTLDDGLPCLLQILWGRKMVLMTQRLRVSEGLRGIIYRLK